jgi:hypothetical protein
MKSLYLRLKAHVKHTVGFIQDYNRDPLHGTNFLFPADSGQIPLLYPKIGHKCLNCHYLLFKAHVKHPVDFTQDYEGDPLHETCVLC